MEIFLNSRIYNILRYIISYRKHTEKSKGFYEQKMINVNLFFVVRSFFRRHSGSGGKHIVCVKKTEKIPLTSHIRYDIINLIQDILRLPEFTVTDILTLTNLSKSFGETSVIKDLSFTVAKGEFLTILGSSGCGKTTLLRIISGLEEPDTGSVYLNGKDVTKLPPNLRSVNTVFQNYALFPHMNASANIAYPLKIAGVPKDEIRRRVDDALSLVQMEGYGSRYPHALSGGQRQRFAIARAVVGQPEVLLLDEPLGALDLNLRRAMQTELKRIQQQLGITFVYITHDQEEALNMSDRVAVMHGGKFLQMGTPAQIYDEPETVYTAKFVGGANILPCTFLRYTNDAAAVAFGEYELIVRPDQAKHNPGDTVMTALRGEKLQTAENGIPCTVTDVNFAGGIMRITAEYAGTTLTAMRYGLDTSVKTGDTVPLVIPELAGILCRP